jgi:hypothetical protein
MVDGTLRRPFFAHDSKGQVIGLGEDPEWRIESNGTFMINARRRNFGQSELEKEDPGKFIDALENKEDLFDEDIPEERNILEGAREEWEL